MDKNILSVLNEMGAEKVARQLLYAAGQFDSFSFLESASASNPITNSFSSSYDFICGISSKQEICSLNNPFADIQEFTAKNKGQWIFGHLNYDIKNSVEPSLSSNQPDSIGFPAFRLFVPETVVICQNGNIRTWGNKALLQEILTASEPISFLEESAEKHSVTAVSFKEYKRNFEKIRFHLQRGDIYEINYCIPFIARNISLNMPTIRIKQKIKSPAPFSALYKSGHHWLSCASPERFIRKTGNKIMSQPIKGTTRRTGMIADDAIAKNQLQNSEKERAENIMIVDLVRNDLSRIAQKGSVQVDQLFGIYEFAQVYQMISTVSATLREDITFTDILKALFPPGSMTGAPKISAMKIIEETESFKRGLFSGMVGYINPFGDFDFNVVIRSILYNEETKTALIPAGGALTIKSNVLDEYNECLLKAQANLDLLSLTLPTTEKARN